MCRIWEEIKNDAKEEVAIRMLQRGKYSLEEISDLNDISIDKLKELQKEITKS